ncbi:MAG: phosphoribosylamine--glycine ligase [Deltaproteobacteria bacterium]|nr:MAG: phosphoribosylamine--glycine ligase [Deltaproteobacteria bacterium]
MNVLLVGTGGREAALAWRIALSPQLGQLTVTGPNPGWPRLAQVREAGTVAQITALARELEVDLVVVGPEAPLAEGLADALDPLGIPCFGPSAAAARIETSKVFAKQIMAEASVQTAGFLQVNRDDPASVERALERLLRGDVVIKADGLAAGKGVFVCRSPDQARAAFDEVMGGRFGQAADTVLLEDLLTGPEVSVFALTDGVSAVGLPSCQDHKALLDGGQGPNTGGMGAYTPCPLLDQAGVEAVVEQVHRPVLRALAARGTPFKGVLYAGLMLTEDGPRVLEFNARFGDPECQALMSLWEDDVLTWLHGAASGALPAGRPRFSEGAACCVVLASRGYPETCERGVIITEGPNRRDVNVFHAATTRLEDGLLRTAGGRVLGVSATGADLEQARVRAYEAVEDWRFEGCQLRCDIGRRLPPS